MADQSNEMGMVERVAVALFSSDKPPHYRFSAASASEKRRYEGLARAAIEAMREPSAEMQDAIMSAISDGTDLVAFEGEPLQLETSRTLGRDVWTAALDAALSHDEVKG